MMRKLLILLLIVVITLVGCTPEVVTKTEYIYVDCPVEVIKEIEVPVEVEIIKTVEIPVYKTIEVVQYKVLSDWTSLEELQAFLVNDNTDSVVQLVANSNGVVTFNNQCEDKAIQLMDNATEAGKRLSFVPICPVEYQKWYGTYPGDNNYHAICGALVGDNEFYYVEPSDDKVWLAQYLD